jgi:hypothetical protein
MLSVLEDRDTLIRSMRLEAARWDFPTFLNFVFIEQVIIRPGQDPEAVGPMRMELWPHLLERAQAWQLGGDEVILKARQLGLSWLAAAFACFKGLQPSSRVLLLSKTEDDAFELLSKVEFVFEHLPEELRKPLETDNKSTLEFEGGGIVRALPSTQNAGRGFTARLVIADEAAFHQWAAQNFKAYRATVADGGQLLILSTANGVGGFFYDRFMFARRMETLRDQLERGTAGEGFDSPEVRAAVHAAPTPVFIPWNARPDRDIFWLEKERLQYSGLPEEFRQEYPANEGEAFVQLTGLVYPQFSLERHVVDHDPCDWGECLYRYASYDLGGGDPTAIVVLGVYRTPEGLERVHQFGQFYRRTGAPTDEELAAFLLAWHRVAPFTSIEPDPVNATTAATLRSHGLPVAESGRFARQERLGVQAYFLDRGFLTIGAHCKESIAEFYGYRWATRVDPNSKDRYKTSTAHDNHADAMDARGLALLIVYFDMMTRAAARSEPVLSIPLKV